MWELLSPWGRLDASLPHRIRRRRGGPLAVAALLTAIERATEFHMTLSPSIPGDGHEVAFVAPEIAPQSMHCGHFSYQDGPDLIAIASLKSGASG